MAIKKFRLTRLGFFGGALLAPGSLVEFETDIDKGGMKPSDNMEPVGKDAEPEPFDNTPAHNAAARVPVAAQPIALADAAPNLVDATIKQPVELDGSVPDSVPPAKVVTEPVKPNARTPRGK